MKSEIDPLMELRGDKSEYSESKSERERERSRIEALIFEGARLLFVTASLG